MLENLQRMGVADKFFYYTSSGAEASQNIWVSATMCFPFARDSFLAAFQDALVDYPEFACTPVISHNELFYKPLVAPAPLVEDDKPRHFATAETNGYPYLFRRIGDTIVFSFYHGISDVDGCWKFFMCLLEHYAKHAGRVAAGVECKAKEGGQVAAGVECKAKEGGQVAAGAKYQAKESGRLTAKSLSATHQESAARQESDRNKDDHQESDREQDPYRFFADARATPPADLYAGPLFIIPEKRRNKNVITTTTVTCSLQELLTLTRAYNTSVAPFVMNAFIRAIAKTYAVGDKPIVGMVAANLRQFFPTKTLRNFSDALIMTSLDTHNQKTFAEQAQTLKQVMKAQMFPEQFSHGFYDRVQWIAEQEASSTPLAELAQQNERALISDKQPPFTFGLSYPGKLEPPKILKDLVVNTGFGGNTGLLYAAGFHTYNDTFSLGISQRFESKELTDAVIEELEKTGLSLTKPHVSETTPDSLLAKDLPEV